MTPMPASAEQWLSPLLDEALALTPEQRLASSARAKLTAVRGEALLHEDRVAEALPVLHTALALNLAQDDPARSPAVAKVRLANAEAQHRAGS